ncbi:MAG: thiamine diphosphokinase [Syntrophales bacterium]|jgi:thiamine pyrophosphokinase|nr:thiamine diphosphokinase [Syntrophales bacterium]MDY0044512.1 thiamine diphosphokinase [Syntrophales bacterium]
MNENFYIISGGEIRDRAFIKKLLDYEPDGLVVCADGGADVCRQIGILPFAIVGDMDSIDTHILTYFEEKGTRILRHPKKKDKTDTELALEYAILMSPCKIRLLGALGGRIDHTFANISLLAAGAKQGIDLRIIDERCEMFVMKKSAVIQGLPDQTVSLFALSEEVTGITLSGFEYSLEEARMEQCHPYGISNSLTGLEGRISIRSGYLLVIHFFEADAPDRMANIDGRTD